MYPQRISRAWMVLVVAVVVGLMVACTCVPPTPVAQQSKPTVVIASAADGAEVLVGQAVSVQAVAADSQGISRVTLSADGVLVDTVNSPSPQPSFGATLHWTPNTPGVHVLTVMAYNASGTASDPVLVKVNATSAQPTATVPTAPVQPTAVPPTAAPTTVPPTAVPPTAVPPTAVPPTAVPPTTPPAPTIKSFTANPAAITAGESSTLQWEVTDADSVQIDQGVGAVALSGSKQVSPAATTTYKLTAKSAGGTVTKQVQVQVNPVPVGDWPLVRYGNQGAAVFAIQYLLRAKGYALTADGIFGPQTQAAVKSFQGTKGLAVDGIVGPNTWTALIQGHTVKMNSTGDAVRAVQHLLQYVYGYNDVAVDGIFGPKTRAAVTAFQMSRGLVVDGIVGPQTWKALVAGT